MMDYRTEVAIEKARAAHGGVSAPMAGSVAARRARHVQRIGGVSWSAQSSSLPTATASEWRALPDHAANAQRSPPANGSPSVSGRFAGRNAAAWPPAESRNKSRGRRSAAARGAVLRAFAAASPRSARPSATSRQHSSRHLLRDGQGDAVKEREKAPRPDTRPIKRAAELSPIAAVRRGSEAAAAGQLSRAQQIKRDMEGMAEEQGKDFGRGL